MDLLKPFTLSGRVSSAAVLVVQHYIEWQSRNRYGDFTPSADDDVDLRTYLFFLRAEGIGPAELARRVGALSQFYGWAHGEGRITHNPFDEYNFNHPSVTRVQIGPRSGAVEESA